MFRADSGWQRFLTQRAVAGIADNSATASPARARRGESATKLHLWPITEQGLTPIFPPYSFGAPYVMGDAQVTIPWADPPYLNPAAPAPIRASV
ncbi:MAG: RsiV family protein [Hyphomonadaceae bacterium]